MNTTRNVAEGNEARLRAWGTVTIDSNGTTATPDGSGRGIADSSAAMPGAPLHSLICAWDSNGNTKFFVGSETTVTVEVRQLCPKADRISVIWAALVLPSRTEGVCPL